MSGLTNLGGGVWAGGPALPRPPEPPPEPKVPAAVVYLERPDGRVLALTRQPKGAPPDFANWQAAGGKWEPCDGGLHHVGEPAVWRAGGHDLVATAIREVQEETGLWLGRANLRPIHDYVTTYNPRRPGSGGRPVRVFVAEGCTWLPPRFALYPAGQPAWVPPSMLTLPTCELADEAEIILRAVADDRARRSQ